MMMALMMWMMKLMMMVMIKVMVTMMMIMMTVLTSLQCLSSAFLPNAGMEARTEQRSLRWTCRQADKS